MLFFQDRLEQEYLLMLKVQYTKLAFSFMQNDLQVYILSVQAILGNPTHVLWCC